MSRWVGRDGLLMRPYRVAGRFVTLRRIYSWLQARLEPEAVDWSPPGSLFPDFRPDACCAELGRRSVAPGPMLPENIVAAIRAFGLTAPCHSPSDARPFRHADVSAGYLIDVGPVPVGDVDRPETCPAIDSLRRDPALLAVARGHLGYWPRHADTRLYWSFIGAIADSARRDHGQTIDFHYDVPWFNAVYVYFYLTDTDRDSGAHVVLPGSALDKPLRFILAGCTRDDSAVDAYYGAGRAMIVQGPAGFGFFEDPYCFHKALVPMTHDRLMLQIRYR